jgi:molecular chaperone DnaK
VTFDIDANGILQVTAQEKSTGKSQEVKIQGSTNISDEEITKAKADAEAFAEEDRKKRELVEAKNRMEALVYQIETMVSEQKDKIPAEEQEVVNKLIADGKALKDKDDVTKEEIEQEIQRIQKEFEVLAQKFQATPSQAAPNPNEELEAGKGTVEGEVIDADK